MSNHHVRAAWTSFAQMPDEVLESKTLTPAAKLVFCALHKYSTMPEGAFPSHEALAERCNVGVSTVKAAIKQLSSEGFLLSVPRFRELDGTITEAGGRRPNTSSFYILFPNRGGSQISPTGWTKSTYRGSQNPTTNKNDLRENELKRSEALTRFSEEEDRMALLSMYESGRQPWDIKNAPQHLVDEVWNQFQRNLNGS